MPNCYYIFLPRAQTIFYFHVFYVIYKVRPPKLLKKKSNLRDLQLFQFMGAVKRLKLSDVGLSEIDGLVYIGSLPITRSRGKWLLKIDGLELLTSEWQFLPTYMH